MKKSHIVFFNLFLIVFILSFFVYKNINYNRKRELQLKYITAMTDRGLYDDAAEEYKEMLRNENSVSRTANLYYLIANLYFEKVTDYKAAVKYYLKYRVLEPKGKLIDEVNTRIVECLERMGKHYDSSLELNDVVTVDKNAVSSDTIIATIGKKNITKSDLDREIGDLPAQLSNYYSTPEKKKEYLYNMIATELLFESAKKMNLENDKDILNKTLQFKKSLMSQKIIEDEIKKKVSVSDKEIELYYEAKKDKFIDKDKKQKSFIEVKDEIKNDILNDKIKELYSSYVQDLYKAENVKIFEQNIK